MTFQNILNFANFVTAVKDSKLPFKTAYKLQVLSNYAQQHTQYYQDQLQSILREYAIIQEDGSYKVNAETQMIEIKDGKTTECLQRIEELQSTEIEEPPFYLNLDDFEGVNLTVVEMSGAQPFIKE